MASKPHGIGEREIIEESPSPCVFVNKMRKMVKGKDFKDKQKKKKVEKIGGFQSSVSLIKYITHATSSCRRTP